MRILTYKYNDVDPIGWHFSKVEFDKVNLLVGDTATGKTRLLNTIFNLGRFSVSNEFKNGGWDITFKHDNVTYRWTLETERMKDDEVAIIQDNIWKIQEGRDIPIVKRDRTSFIFNDREVPKLSSKENSVWLLKEEELIKPIYDGFSNIMQRRFFGDELIKISGYQTIPLNFIEKMKKERSLKTLFQADFNLSGTLYFLSEYYKDIFNKICTLYKSIFPFITETTLLDIKDLNKNIAVPGPMPIFCIKEKGVNKWIPILEISSGMQKVLLILTDIVVFPEGGIYLIDEYENSLGINAIDFFPSFILEVEKDIQFIVTSHHPYIINEIPVKNWYVFHRKGTEVVIKHGSELAERFGKSKQKAFIKLINDSFYTEGVE